MVLALALRKLPFVCIASTMQISAPFAAWEQVAVLSLCLNSYQQYPRLVMMLMIEVAIERIFDQKK